MVPLAVGTQTNGSVIRPAAYCGMRRLQAELRPDLAQRRARRNRAPLDHVGVFARDLEGVALLAEALIGHDPRDPATRARGAARRCSRP